MSLEDTQELSWFEEWFNQEEYELVYQNRNEKDAAQLIDLIETVVQPRPGAKLLDLACGRGRHSRLLAHKGYTITGVDLSPRALQTATHRAVDANLDITFRQGDMRQPIPGGPYEGAVNLFTSFGYFEDDQTHAQVIKNVANALQPNGWFAQDFLNAPLAVQTLVPRDSRLEEDMHIKQERWVEENRLNKRITLHKDGQTHTFRESVRLLTLSEFKQMYAAAGLEMFDIRGSYKGDPYGPETPRLIMFARKKKK